MSFLAPQNTLAYQLKARPLTRKLSYKSATLKDFGGRLFKYANTEAAQKMEVPEHSALRFYLLNHAVRDIRFMYSEYEPLPDWGLDVMSEYHGHAGQDLLRALFYTVVICCREARHCNNPDLTIQKLVSKGGDKAAATAAHKEIMGTTDLNGWVNWFETREKIKLVDLLWALREGFNLNHYGGSFGGKPWGSIADCALQYVEGNYSAEMFMDMVWTLCHNNGPIFNKGFLYGHYDGTALRMILDVQRSGQIPQLVRTGLGSQQLPTDNYCAPVREDLGWLFNVIPSHDFDTHDPVDFQKVVELGAVGHYHAYLPDKAVPKKPAYVAPKITPKPEKYDAKTHYIILPKEGYAFKKTTADRKKEAA